MTTLELLKYFDKNIDIENANCMREFAPVEQFLLIIASKTVALKEKFSDLRKIEKELDEKMKNELNIWIEWKEKQMEFVENLEDEDIVFVVNANKDNKIPLMFRTFKKAEAVAKELRGNIVVYSLKNNFIKATITFNEKGTDITDITVIGEKSLKLDKKLRIYDSEISLRLLAPNNYKIVRRIENGENRIIEVKEI